MNALTVLALALAAGGGRDADVRDVVRLKEDRELRGRVLALHEPGSILMLDDKGKERRIPRKEFEGAETVRDRLAAFLELRDGKKVVGEEWALAETAERFELTDTARVQAWHVLLMEPEHAGAHEMLGHERKGREWRWRHEKRHLRREEFEERIAEWNHRFVLESEHWIVETDCGVRLAVDVAMDLERLYVEWMKTYGEALEAREFVRDPRRKMVIWIVADHGQNGVPWILPSEHAPYYSAGKEVSTPSGNENLAITYRGGGKHPARLFDIATQQLMYSLLVLGDVKGDLPPDDRTRHSHWVELGMGEWFGSQIDGEPGYVRRRGPWPDPTISRMAKAPPVGNLRMADKELTNLVGLPMEDYYVSSTDDDILRAKSCSFFQFLEQTDPPVPRRRGQPPASGREGLYCYLREVYGTPKAHSSSALDECLGGGSKTLEKLEEHWKAWRGRP